MKKTNPRQLLGLTLGAVPLLSMTLTACGVHGASVSSTLAQRQLKTPHAAASPNPSPSDIPPIPTARYLCSSDADPLSASNTAPLIELTASATDQAVSTILANTPLEQVLFGSDHGLVGISTRELSGPYRVSSISVRLGTERFSLQAASLPGGAMNCALAGAPPLSQMTGLKAPAANWSCTANAVPLTANGGATVLAERAPVLFNAAPSDKTKSKLLYTSSGGYNGPGFRLQFRSQGGWIGALMTSQAAGEPGLDASWVSRESNFISYTTESEAMNLEAATVVCTR